MVRVLLDKNLFNFLLGLPLIELILKKMKEINELRKILASMSVNELMEMNNEITAEIHYKRSNVICKNTRVLDAEIRNLLDGVGDGYTPEDNYAKERYYSTIDGVKNLRIHIELGESKEIVQVITVKLLSPKGKLLPETIKVRNKEYKIEFWRSKNYDSRVDY